MSPAWTVDSGGPGCHRCPVTVTHVTQWQIPVAGTESSTGASLCELPALSLNATVNLRNKAYDLKVTEVCSVLERPTKISARRCGWKASTGREREADTSNTPGGRRGSRETTPAVGPDT